MSGIVGIVNLDVAPVDPNLLQRMTQYLAPIGPDGQQVWTGGPVGFGHTLLRTTAESASERQPCTLDGQTWIVADCRVDARADLLRELAAHDADARKDAPDAELILHAYRVWGEGCLDHLLGDFAFAIWDAPRRRLFCARDHFGVKPFFYAQAGGVFVFSNVLNCLRLHPAVSARLDEQWIGDFLVFGYPLDSARSSFADIRRLPPSHALRVSADGAAAVRQYFEAPDDPPIVYRRRGEYVERFRELLDTATRDRLRTDRVSVLMSGGLDSPTIAASASRLLSASGAPFDLSAHTIVFDRITPDQERRYSQIVADAIGIRITHYPFDDFGFPPPEAEPAGYPPEPRLLFDRVRTIAVHRPAAAAARVVLRGEGADPLLDAAAPQLDGQLREHRYAAFARDFFWLAWSRRQIPRIGLRTYLRKSIGRVPPPDMSPFPEWIASDFERRLGLRERWQAQGPMDDTRTWADLVHPYWTFIFDSVDYAGMGLPAEMRYPFFDLRLARYLLRVPNVPWCVEKSLLRVALKGVLPSAIWRRRKSPVAGNPWASLVPPGDTGWWEPHMVPAPGLEDFVDLRAANATLARSLRTAQARNAHGDIDDLRSSLGPLSLNLWLRQRGPC